MESKLINYEIFISKRPDMEVHTQQSIVSCINSAYVILDGECAGLISKVENFNYDDNGIIADRDKNDVLYRTDFELNQLQEALVFQVQYVLNMGNDFTIGGGSYSLGNVNSSYNRPEGRELIAPGVYKLLSNARVYNLNAFGSFNDNNNNCNISLSTSKEIMERVKNEYVAINQPNAKVGNVAYVNENNKVSFGTPQDLNITTYNTLKIAGPEGYRTSFYEIDKVPNIAFFGPDLDGTFSAVHRKEVLDLIDNNNNNVDLSNYYDKQEIDTQQQEQNANIQNNKQLINDVINGLNNSTLINYKGEWKGGTALLGEVWSFNNQLWLCKVQQTNNEPQDGNEWDLLTSPSIDLSDYFTKEQIEQKLNLKADLTNKKQIITTDGIKIDRFIYTSNGEARYGANDNCFYYKMPRVGNLNSMVPINSFDLTHKKYVDEKFNENKTNIDNIEVKANANEASILNINRIIETLNENQKNDISMVGEITTNKTYKLNDCGFIGDKWYIAIKDNVSGDVSNKTNWKEISSPQAQVDLSNYYNKVETNQLLQPLETRLVGIETKNTQQDTQIEQNTNNINTINTKLNDYYTKQDWNSFGIVAKINELYFVNDFINIFAYGDNELCAIAPKKITNIIGKGNEVFRSELREDGFYINNVKAATVNDLSNYFTKQETKDYVANNTMAMLEVTKGNNFVVEGNLIYTNYLGSITQTGYYKSASYRNNYSDLPKGVNGNGSGLLVHINFSNDRALQMWYARENSQNYYQRHKTGSSETSWTPWTKFSGVVES